MKVRSRISLLLLFIAGTAAAQIIPSNSPYDKMGFSNNGMSGGVNPYAAETVVNDPNQQNGNMSADSMAPRRERKPLKSFYFEDSLQLEKIFVWNVNPMYNTITRQKVDTLLDGFQRDYVYMKEELGAFSLGNLAGATLPVNYFRRPKYKQFSFLEAWDSYLMTPERILFYNAKIPYSRFEYELSGQKKLEENLFRFIFSANASPSTSFNFQYKSDGTKGMYSRQKGLDRYLSISADHTGERYAVHGGYIFNYGNIYENGGVRNDRDVTDTVYATADQVLVKLPDAENTYRGHTIWWSQSYAIPMRQQKEDEFTLSKVPTLFIGQGFNYTKFVKQYGAKNDTALYSLFLVDPIETTDSISQSLLDANLFAQFQPYDRNGALGLMSAGIGFENAVYYNFIPKNYRQIFGSGGSDSKSSSYIYGGLQGKVGKYASWNADMKYYFMGYRSQDIDIGGALSLSAYIKDQPLTLDLSADFSLSTPDYWAQNYFSNHYAWVNNFSKEKYLKLKAAFKVPSWNMEVGASYEISDGKIYYDSLSMPKQYNSGLSIVGVYLKKNFKAGGFHFNHQVLGQFTSNDAVVPLPSLSAYLSYYFEFNVVKNVLRMQTGIDGRYNTSYYAPGWDPALGKFFNQREKEIGGYPYLDFFVTAKWKRMLILLKLQHFNCNFFPKNREYFQILHHPQNRMMLKFGFSWSFYD